MMRRPTVMFDVGRDVCKWRLLLNLLIVGYNSELIRVVQFLTMLKINSFLFSFGDVFETYRLIVEGPLPFNNINGVRFNNRFGFDAHVSFFSIFFIPLHFFFKLPELSLNVLHSLSYIFFLPLFRLHLVVRREKFCLGVAVAVVWRPFISQLLVQILIWPQKVLDWQLSEVKFEIFVVFDFTDWRQTTSFECRMLNAVVATPFLKLVVFNAGLFAHLAQHWSRLRLINMVC